MGEATHNVVARGEGELVIDDISKLGLKEGEAVEAAMFFVADDLKAVYKRVMDFGERRAMVESLVDDEDHFAKHTSQPKREEDGISICSFVKGEAFQLHGRLDDLLAIAQELPPKELKRISPEGHRARMALDSLHKALLLGILSVEMTGKPAEDDNDDIACDILEATYFVLDKTIMRLSKLRADWGRRVLRKRSPKLVAKLEAMSAQRVRNIAKAKADFEAGKISREEAMLAQYQGVELVTKDEAAIDVDTQGPPGEDDA